MLSVVPAVIDADLIRCAGGRERRDKDPVLATGSFLPVCAGPLVLLEGRQPSQLVGETPPARQG